jgi:hypothetical protein
MSLNLFLIRGIKNSFVDWILIGWIRGKYISPKKSPKALNAFGDSLLCLSGLRKQPAFIVQLRGLEARAHKLSHPKRQRTPFRVAQLMLVASGQRPSAFLFIYGDYGCEGRLGCPMFLPLPDFDWKRFSPALGVEALRV